jgi:hypothetical protein
VEAAGAASSAVASAAMPAASGMPAASAVTAEAGMVCETVAAMVLVAMIPAMVPAVPAAIVKKERAIDRVVGVSIVAVGGRAVFRLHRTCGQEKSDTDQERYGFRHCSAAIHRSLRLKFSISWQMWPRPAGTIKIAFNDSALSADSSPAYRLIFTSM